MRGRTPEDTVESREVNGHRAVSLLQVCVRAGATSVADEPAACSPKAVMNEQMDGWMDGWIDGEMEEGMIDEQMCKKG